MRLARSSAAILAVIVFLLSVPVGAAPNGAVHSDRVRHSIERSAVEAYLVSQPNIVIVEINLTSSSRAQISPAVDTLHQSFKKPSRSNYYLSVVGIRIGEGIIGI